MRASISVRWGSSRRRLQFVMDVDELIYRVFCPRKLRLALDDAAELEAPALPSFKGLDSGPVLKLLAVMIMIALMAGTSILPMFRTLFDAGDSLCGALPRSCERACAHARTHACTRVCWAAERAGSGPPRGVPGHDLDLTVP